MKKEDIKKFIIEDFSLNEKDILTIFSYGSRVYKTDSEKSDYDFIIIMNDDSIDRDSMQSSYHNINCSIYRISSFQDLLDRHKVSSMECFFLPNDLRLKNDAKLSFSLDKKKLRHSISKKSSESWVKSSKKFEVEKDRNVYIAKKSLFHSLRIIDFGIQIAKFGTIKDYQSSNYLWEEIKNNPEDTWLPYKEKYQLFYNKISSEFKQLATK